MYLSKGIIKGAHRARQLWSASSGQVLAHSVLLLVSVTSSSSASVLWWHNLDTAMPLRTFPFLSTVGTVSSSSSMFPARLIPPSVDGYQIWTSPLNSGISSINNQQLGFRERKGYSRAPEVMLVLTRLKAHCCKLFITVDFLSEEENIKTMFKMFR